MNEYFVILQEIKLAKIIPNTTVILAVIYLNTNLVYIKTSYLLK